MSTKEKLAQITEDWRQIDRLYQSHAKSLGLNSLSLMILEYLAETPHCTQKDICEKNNLPKQSVNLVIKSFLEQGYVEMKEVKFDRRNKAIFLTEKGTTFAQSVIFQSQEIEDEIWGNATEEEIDAMLNMLAKWQQALKKRL